MNKQTTSIDLIKLAFYILKRCWLIILCAGIGFGYMYWQTAYKTQDTYTASGTMYVYNGNPNLVNYGYTSSSDLNSAVKLMDTYLVVVRSNKVLDVVVERLSPEYPKISAGYIAGTLSMGSVSDTSVLRISCTTDDPQKSADICNAVMDVAPSEIIRVVSAGSIEIIDYANPPAKANARPLMKNGMLGAAYGAIPVIAVLTILFLMNQKIEDEKELEEAYKISVLAALKRYKEESADPGKFLLSSDSEMEVIEGYAKLRMNLLYTLVGKKSHAVIITSGISGEGKSTIAANLAISVAMSGKRVLLVDADMRRACQHQIFKYDDKLFGLSDVLVGACSWQDELIKSNLDTMDILPAGTIPPNPAELLESPAMRKLLNELEEAYDLVLLDAPPINIVSDPLALSDQVAGGIFVVRQHLSDHREVQKALTQAKMTGMQILGFVFYGENLRRSGYYSRKYYYYKGHYHRYDTREKYDTRNKYDTRGRASQEIQAPGNINEQQVRGNDSDEQEQIGGTVSGSNDYDGAYGGHRVSRRRRKQ